VWHAIEVDAGLDIVSKFVLQVASNLAFEQGKTIMCRAGSICLLDHELSAIIETLTKKAAAINTAKRTKIICKVSRWEVPEVGANIPIRNCDYKLTQPELAYDLRSGVSRAIRLSHPQKFMPQNQDPDRSFHP
jgi:hypothetical protein